MKFLRIKEAYDILCKDHIEETKYQQPEEKEVKYESPEDREKELKDQAEWNDMVGRIQKRAEEERMLKKEEELKQQMILQMEREERARKEEQRRSEQGTNIVEEVIKIAQEEARLKQMDARRR